MSDGLDRYFGLAGKGVLLTGAARGIGLAMAEAFAAAGARLVLADKDVDGLRAVADRLGAVGVATDVTVTAELDVLLDRAIEALGGVDVLVCNAGLPGPYGPMGEADAAGREALFAVNLAHPLHLSTRTAAHMAGRGGGAIVLTASIAGLRGNAKIGLYGLTKAALMQLARNLAVEWGPSGVRANAIAPGLIRTDWASAILSSPEASARRLGATPLRRVGEPWEVAAAALSGLCLRHRPDPGG